MVALAALSGCELYEAEPPAPDARPMPHVMLHGVIEMTSQTIFEPEPECHAPPDGPMRLTIVDGDPKTLTIDPPAVISNVQIRDGGNPADVSFTLVADWGDGFTPTISYYFEAFFGGLVQGDGNFDHAGCRAFVSLEGHWGDV